MTENTENKAPTATEIDALAGLYADAKANLAIAQERVDLLGDQLIEMTRTHGVTPPKAEKSLRIEGDDWEVTVSEGQSVSVNKAAAAKVLASLKRAGLIRFFRKLFVVETQYKLAKGAQALIAKPLPNGAPSNLRKLLAEAIQIKDKAPASHRGTKGRGQEVKRPRLTCSADHAIWLAMRFLDSLAVAGSGCGGCYPAAFAHHSGLSKLEAQLALRMCVEIGFAVRRNGGRYFKDTRTAQ